MARSRSILFQACCLLPVVIVFLNKCDFSHSHSKDYVVNFNDLLGRPVLIDSVNKTQWLIRFRFGEFEFRIRIATTDAKNLESALISRVSYQKPYSGVLMIACTETFAVWDTTNQISSLLGRNYQYICLLLPSSDGKLFWRLDEPKGLTTTSIICHQIVEKNIKQLVRYELSLAKFQTWKLIQSFDWEGAVFACFQISPTSVVILRLKPFPEDKKDIYAFYLSAMVISATEQPVALFLPSYPTPMMFFSREKIGNSTSYHSINLLDIIPTLDENSVTCSEGNPLPDNVYDLEIYLNTGNNVTGTETRCPKTIPFQFYEQTTEGFDLPSEYIPKSLDTFYVGYKFGFKVVAYVEGNNDYRCYIEKCGEMQPKCIAQPYESEDQINSTWWDPDSFVLKRFDGAKNSTTLYRLLDCEYYADCQLCTLFGGFNCAWNSGKCVKKAGSGDEPIMNPCFSKVTGTQKNLTSTTAELRIQMPFVVDENVGEIPYVIVNDMMMDAVYGGNEYIAEVQTTDIKSLIIGIQRGAYKMEHSVTLEAGGGISNFLILIIAIALLIVVGVVILAFVTKGKREQQMDPDSGASGSSNPTPGTSKSSEQVNKKSSTGEMSLDSGKTKKKTLNNSKSMSVDQFQSKSIAGTAPKKG